MMCMSESTNRRPSFMMSSWSATVVPARPLYARLRGLYRARAGSQVARRAAGTCSARTPSVLRRAIAATGSDRRARRLAETLRNRAAFSRRLLVWNGSQRIMRGGTRKQVELVPLNGGPMRAYRFVGTGLYGDGDVLLS